MFHRRALPGKAPAMTAETGQDTPFTIRAAIVDFGAGVVELEGPIDVAALPQLKDEILRLLALGCTQLIVDLSGVTELDPAALALLELTRGARMKRSELAVVDPDGERASKLDGHGFLVFGSLDEAQARFAIPSESRPERR
jgi:anti-anti-sigma regulatory factor